MNPTLTAFGDDLLVQILMFSDIGTVLRVSQLWLSLIRDLEEMGIAELCTNIVLVHMGCSELIQIAKTAVMGLPLEAFSRPQIIYEVALRPNSTNSGRQMDEFRYARLVQGGHQVVIVCATSLSLWDISSARQVWTRKIVYEVFVAEPINAGGQSKILEFTEIDIRTGETVEYGGIRMPNYGAYFRGQMSLCCEVAALIVYSGCILLMNWRKHTALFARVPSSELLTRETKFGIYLLATDPEWWSSIDPSKSSAPETGQLELEPLLVKTFSWKGGHGRNYSGLSALRSPVRKDTYLIMLHASSQNCGAIFKYSFTVNPSEIGGDKEISLLPLAGETAEQAHSNYSKLTYTGLALDPNMSEGTLYRLHYPDQGAVE
ncbi:hypothetical protein B0H13DRAFT_1911625 [Mycena leptocephala]|nr:hypothetical protein B0H13DRAFT_1911625 [Mycena leptocephala]